MAEPAARGLEMTNGSPPASSSKAEETLPLQAAWIPRPPRGLLHSHPLSEVRRGYVLIYEIVQRIFFFDLF